MALPCRQQRLLEAIDHQLTNADPHLAWLLGAFGRLCADEPLPAREGAWPVPPLTDPPATDAAGHAGAGHGSILPPGQVRQSPDWHGRHGRRPRGRG
jgi:hypothetical protein